MDQRIYQIYDRVSQCVLGPVVAQRNDGSAVRMFYDVLADDKTEPGRHPEDFELFYICSVSDVGVVFDVPDRPVCVTTGAVWMELQRLSLVKPEAVNG